MKKSTIWILAGIMAVAFFGLLYLQINYFLVTIQSRGHQFDEAVTRSLYQVMRNLELDQTRRYLQEEYSLLEENAPPPPYGRSGRPSPSALGERKLSGERNTSVLNHSLSVDSGYSRIFISPNHGNRSISRTSYAMQEERRKRYFYERDLIDNVINNILYKSPSEPIENRVNYKDLDSYIKAELLNNGILLPFSFKIVDKDDRDVYVQRGFKPNNRRDIYVQVLFQNDPPSKQYRLMVNFPTRQEYIASAVSFFVPSVAFTIILLVTFIVSIFLIFRQKRLAEMKNDFINNMTHELKTPVSTISLASQMLKNESVEGVPDSFRHIANIISDETKRLSFQVEKVLQMSLFEKQQATLKLEELDVNDIVASVANTFQLKVEKFGGTIDIDLQALDSEIMADQMHFTNVLFNLLDNAVKYRQETVPLKLMIRTWNEGRARVFISVEDNGIGIKKEHQKRIFDRFFRVPTGNVHDVKGFGLGLAYVYKIVKDHKGSIKAESEIKKGTKFIINLPTIK